MVEWTFESFQMTQGARVSLGIWFAHNVVFNFMYNLNITYEDTIPCVENGPLKWESDSTKIHVLDFIKL